jgi:hypothetical protein
MTSVAGLNRLLESYPPEIRELVLGTRGLILDCIPGADETVDAKDRVIGYGFGAGYAGVICTIILSKTGAKLGLVRGAELPDPKRLLEGSGRVHRYVQIRSVADLEKPGLRPLLKASHTAWKRRREGRESRS